MGRIRNYMDFINEEFFKNVFKKKKEKAYNNKIDEKVESIIDFLKENGIIDWNDFQNMGKFDEEVVKSLITHDAKDQEEINNIYFRIRLELSDKEQLKEYLKELENEEDYEKCAIIVKKISKIK